MGVSGVYTLLELINRYEPLEDGRDSRLLRLHAPPSGFELLAHGKLEIGEIGLVKNLYGLSAIYGTEGEIYSHEEILLHNHPGTSVFPSPTDAGIARRDRVRRQYISNKTHIAQISYMFVRRSADDAAVVVDHSDLSIRAAQSSPDDLSVDPNIPNPLTFRGLICPRKKKFVGYDVTVMPWAYFLSIYTPDSFSFLFDRRRSWEKMVSGVKNK